MNSHSLRSTLILTMALLFGSVAWGQITVSGVVTDANSGDPMIGAAVVIEGTTVGVSTGLDGDYTISVADESQVLVYSFVGYEEQKVTVGQRTTINVALNSSVLSMQRQNV